MYIDGRKSWNLTKPCGVFCSCTSASSRRASMGWWTWSVSASPASCLSGHSARGTSIALLTMAVPHRGLQSACIKRLIIRFVVVVPDFLDIAVNFGLERLLALLK